MQFDIEGKSAVVFAASKGLGKAAALALAAEGCRVAVCGRTPDTLAEAATEICSAGAADVLTEVVDVMNRAEIESFVESIARAWDGIDILVTNAGGPPVKTFMETSDEEWQEWYQKTFMSVVRSIKTAVPYMEKKGWGRIINITSISVKAPVESLVYANALRMAVVGLAKTLSLELGPMGITVNNVAPGYHLTDGLERIIRKKVEQGTARETVLENWEKKIPMRRIGRPEDLASLITFLASEPAGYLSGTTIPCDGGMYSGTM